MIQGANRVGRPKTGQTNVCAVCGESFYVRASMSARQHCSRACSDKAKIGKVYPRNELAMKWKVRVCPVCGKEYTNPCSANKYCSQECAVSTIRGIHRTRVHVKCQHCGEMFMPGRGENKGMYCSRTCSFEAKAQKSKERAAIKLLVSLQKKAAKLIPANHCKHCGKATTRLTYCSERCRYENNKAATLQRMRDKYEKVAVSVKACAVCGKDFIGHSKRLTCSDRCSKKRNKTHDHRKRARKHGVVYEPVNVISVFDRDGWKCQICGCKTPRTAKGKNRPNSPELDHRVPISKGGGHTYDNVQCSCRRCNGEKSNKGSAGQIPLFSNINDLRGYPKSHPSFLS